MAVDQARNGAWSLFEYDTKTLVDYGTFRFDAKKYPYERALVEIEQVIKKTFLENSCGAVFFEDIQMQRNVNSFKKLAWLQGALISMCERYEFLYGLITPSQWQSFCKARGRTLNEVKKKLTKAETEGKRVSKIFSIQAVKDKYGVETENDNLADAILIGDYVVNNVKLISKSENVGECTA